MGYAGPQSRRESVYASRDIAAMDRGESAYRITQSQWWREKFDSYIPGAGNAPEAVAAVSEFMPTSSEALQLGHLTGSLRFFTDRLSRALDDNTRATTQASGGVMPHTAGTEQE